MALKNDIDKITNNGLVSRGIPDYYSPRYELDEAADQIGREIYPDWASRVHGVYFWETREQAIRETPNPNDYILIEVDLDRIRGPLWKVESRMWEDLYSSTERPSDIERGSELWNQIKHIVKESRKFDGHLSGSCELWTPSPVSPDVFVDVSSDISHG